MSDYNNQDLAQVKKGDWVCNIAKLHGLLAAQKNELAFYCGTASNIDEFLPLFNSVILLKPSLATIEHRLESRKPGEFGYNKEVRDWVLSWKDWWEEEIADKVTNLITVDLQSMRTRI